MSGSWLKCSLRSSMVYIGNFRGEGPHLTIIITFFNAEFIRATQRNQIRMSVIVDRAHRVCEGKYLYCMPINKSTFLRVNVLSSVAQ